MVHSHKFHWDCSSGSWSTVATRLVQMNGLMNERTRQMDSNAFADSVGWSRRNEHCVASLINKHCTFCAIIYKYVQAVLNQCGCQPTIYCQSYVPTHTSLAPLLQLWPCCLDFEHFQTRYFWTHIDGKMTTCPGFSGTVPICYDATRKNHTPPGTPICPILARSRICPDLPISAAVYLQIGAKS